ncbi:hypothetical protein [Paraconexibacter algicola]|uniref:Uncharacterized protein n=1 Tax=Paraconexibacter algicola TaxID=2133960 RepID=A0A2T4ULL9_9ACTN|nr:hypothetical protein [Paraconexibacter algicola]PTL60147.1 hypothetical protein C7Y72_11095 [Paraconexibacter algicola]
MRTPSAVLSAATLAAALLAAAPAVQAAPITSVAADQQILDGPVFAGDTVAWAAGTRPQRLRAVVAGGAPRTLARTPAFPEGGEAFTFGLEGSPTRLAWGFGEGVAVDPDGYTTREQVVAGPPGGPLVRVAGDGADAVRATAMDLDGDRLVTSEDIVAEGQRPSSVLRGYDLAAGGDPTALAPQGSAELATAGPYVAYRSASTTGGALARIVVADAATGTPVYGVDVPTVPPIGYGLRFDLQADGTLAVLTANPAATGSDPVLDLAWASIADPTLHVIVPDVTPFNLRIAANRIVYGRELDRRSSRLFVADLAGVGHPVTPVVDSVTGVDFDGTRLGWSTEGCVYAGDLPAAAVDALPGGRCAGQDYRLVTGTLNRRAARALVRCVAGPATGCAGTAKLTRAGGGPTLARTTFTVGARKQTSIVLPLRPAVLRALQRSARRKKARFATLRIVTSVTDGAGNVNTRSIPATGRVR